MDSLTKEQTRLVNEFAEKHNVSKEISLRFLLGRKWDQLRADSLLENYTTLLGEKKFDNLTINDVLVELQTGKLVIPGFKAIDGSEILLIDALKHEPGQFSDESTLTLSFFMAEVITKEVDAQRDGITVLCNMKDLKWEQSDYAFYRDVVQLFQNNFPCRVKNIIVYCPPWWIKMLIAFVEPFLKPKMRERIHIETSQGALLTWIDTAALPVELGGMCHYDHDAFIRRQMAKTSTAKMSGLLSAGEALQDIALRDDGVVSEVLAEELVEEREKAVQEIDAAIRKRRGSLSAQQRPVDLTKLARSQAARMAVSLPDSMELTTPTAPNLDEEETTSVLHVSEAEEIVDVETITEPNELDEPDKKVGFLNFSDEEDEKLDVEKIDLNETAKVLASQFGNARPRKQRSKKPRPVALQK